MYESNYSPRLNQTNGMKYFLRYIGTYFFGKKLEYMRNFVKILNLYNVCSFDFTRCLIFSEPIYVLVLN